MRLSDAERDDAMEALSEHVRTGRLDVEEFGNRSARVTTARTRSDLLPLFEDLPEPHPSVLRKHEPPPSAPPARRFTGLVPIAAIVALLLFVTVARTWFVFALPLVVALVVGAKSK